MGRVLRPRFTRRLSRSGHPTRCSRPSLWSGRVPVERQAAGAEVRRLPAGGGSREGSRPYVLRALARAPSAGASEGRACGPPFEPPGARCCGESESTRRRHGFRSSFRDWCGATEVPREVAETCFARTIRNQAEVAYARSDLLDRRLKSWSRGPSTAWNARPTPDYGRWSAQSARRPLEGLRGSSSEGSAGFPLQRR